MSRSSYLLSPIIFHPSVENNSNSNWTLGELLLAKNVPLTGHFLERSRWRHLRRRYTADTSKSNHLIGQGEVSSQLANGLANYRYCHRTSVARDGIRSHRWSCLRPVTRPRFDVRPGGVRPGHEDNTGTANVSFSIKSRPWKQHMRMSFRYFLFADFYRTIRLIIFSSKATHYVGFRYPCLFFSR